MDFQWYILDTLLTDRSTGAIIESDKIIYNHSIICAMLGDGKETDYEIFDYDGYRGRDGCNHLFSGGKK